jgi:hypothetical protein
VKINAKNGEIAGEKLKLTNLITMDKLSQVPVAERDCEENPFRK